MLIFFRVAGATISVGFEAKYGECARVCCDVGGPFVIERSCSPSYKCRGIHLTKETEDCESYCNKDDCRGSSGNFEHSVFHVLLKRLIRCLIS